MTRELDVQMYEGAVWLEINAPTTKKRIEFTYDESMSLADKFTEVKHAVKGGYEQVTVQARDLKLDDYIESLGVYVHSVLPHPGKLGLVTIKVTDNPFSTCFWELNLAFHLPITVLQKIS